MRKRLYLALWIASSLIIGASAGYFYRDRSADLASYDSSLVDVSMKVLMMDALQNRKYDVLESALASDIEGGMSRMILLYDRYKFNEAERLRCAVTRKARVLYENKKILASREKLEELEYPYGQVTTYLASTCEGKPSHDNWTEVNKPTIESYQLTGQLV
jgi:hypothetical protein